MDEGSWGAVTAIGRTLPASASRNTQSGLVAPYVDSPALKENPLPCTRCFAN